MKEIKLVDIWGFLHGYGEGQAFYTGKPRKKLKDGKPGIWLGLEMP